MDMNRDARYRLSDAGKNAAGLGGKYGPDVEGTRIDSPLKDAELVGFICICVDGTQEPEHWLAFFWEPVDPTPDVESRVSEATLEAVRLVQKGVALNDACRAAGQTTGAVCNYMRRHGIPYRRHERGS